MYNMVLSKVTVLELLVVLRAHLIENTNDYSRQLVILRIIVNTASALSRSNF